MKKNPLWYLLLVLLLLTACPSSTDSQNSQKVQSLRVGFIPSENSAEIQRNAQPLVDQLSASLKREVQPFIATDYTGIVEAFRNHRLDMAFLTPASYVMAHAEANVKVILRAQRGKLPYYYSVIFTRKDSGVNSLKDLKGKTFAFGDNLSTAGYIYPLQIFRKQGINPETDFENTIFSGGHDATVLAVYNQKVTAGATYANDAEGKDAAWNHILTPEQSKDIKVLAVSEPIPADNICVSADMKPETTEAIRTFFANLGKTPEGHKLLQDLYRIDLFVPANDDDYKGIREAFGAAGIKIKKPETAASPASSSEPSS